MDVNIWAFVGLSRFYVSSQLNKKLINKIKMGIEMQYIKSARQLPTLVRWVTPRTKVSSAMRKPYSSTKQHKPISAQPDGVRMGLWGGRGWVATH